MIIAGRSLSVFSNVTTPMYTILRPRSDFSYFGQPFLFFSTRPGLWYLSAKTRVHTCSFTPLICA